MFHLPIISKLPVKTTFIVYHLFDKFHCLILATSWSFCLVTLTTTNSFCGTGATQVWPSRPHGDQLSSEQTGSRVTKLGLRRVNAFAYSLQNMLQDKYETVFWWSSQCLLNHDEYFGQIYGTPWCTNAMHQLPKFGSFFHLPDPISLVMQSVSNPYKSAARCRETVVENCVGKNWK